MAGIYPWAMGDIERVPCVHLLPDGLASLMPSAVLLDDC